MRIRDFQNASVSVAPAEHASWQAVREELVRERVAPLRKKLNDDIAGAATDEEQQELRDQFKIDQAAVESEVDNTRYDMHIELGVKYNFLSSTSPEKAASA